jgi:hypothetical protein
LRCCIRALQDPTVGALLIRFGRTRPAIPTPRGIGERVLEPASMPSTHYSRSSSCAICGVRKWEWEGSQNGDEVSRRADLSSQ